MAYSKDFCSREVSPEDFYEIVSECWWANHPGFSANHSTEGYRGYTFGGKVGPSILVSGVMHEMAHAVEFLMQDCKAFSKRVSMEGGFLFKRPKPTYLFGKVLYNYMSTQPSERECRVFGIEYVIAKSVGLMDVSLSDYIDGCISVLDFMPDYLPSHKNDMREIIKQYSIMYSEKDVNTLIENWLDKTAKRIKRNKITFKAFNENLKGIK